jgi:hypothetical protein
MGRPRGRQQPLEQRGPGPGRGGAEPGRVPFVGIGRQRELGHQQQSAADLLQIKVHLAGIIRKKW